MKKKIEKGDIWTGNSTMDQRTLLVVEVVKETRDRTGGILCLFLIDEIRQEDQGKKRIWMDPDYLTSRFNKLG
jgi:hypothetical protein